MAVSTRAVSSVGERMLHTHEVAGSKPAPPTTEPRVHQGLTSTPYGCADLLGQRLPNDQPTA